MENHPIQGLMDTAMSNIKAMVDVDTVVGDAVTAPDGTLIIPISTVSFGFGAGGSEFSPKNSSNAARDALFGGGCGGGAKVKPIGFLVVSGGNVRLLPVTQSSSSADKLVDMIPEMLSKVNGAISGAASKIAEKKEKKAEKKAEKENAKKEENGVVDVVAP